MLRFLLLTLALANLLISHPRGWKKHKKETKQINERLGNIEKDIVGFQEDILEFKEDLQMILSSLNNNPQEGRCRIYSLG